METAHMEHVLEHKPDFMDTTTNNYFDQSTLAGLGDYLQYPGDTFDMGSKSTFPSERNDRPADLCPQCPLPRPPAWTATHS